MHMHMFVLQQDSVGDDLLAFWMVPGAIRALPLRPPDHCYANEVNFVFIVKSVNHCLRDGVLCYFFSSLIYASKYRDTINHC